MSALPSAAPAWAALLVRGVAAHKVMASWLAPVTAMAPALFARRRPESSRLEVLGFTLAWLMTAGAAAVVAGHVIARSSELPAIVWLPAAPSAGAAASAQASCASPGAPPLMAVGDLPIAAPPAPVAVTPARSSYRAPARVPVQSSRPPPRSIAGRRASFPETPATSQQHAKAGRKSLKDWMREAAGPA